MSKFIDLLKATILRERQWQDTRTAAEDSDFLDDQEAIWRTAHTDAGAYPATVPMPIGRH
ncbi:hypothetical protein HK414_10630 [Ramlibacter terrae]|uniref:Uncharacterized protein n=1 Tax=Ramlibacter terrae TaxID=2732511 RepID=A0ABX6P372_9BURK|nr:hypothetical protein HK414_10630 [Ramlibacter terrae]